MTSSYWVNDLPDERDLTDFCTAITEAYLREEKAREYANQQFNYCPCLSCSDTNL